jgi:hypothetical protein
MSIQLASQLNDIGMNSGWKIHDVIWPRKRDCQLNVHGGTEYGICTSWMVRVSTT